MALSINVLSSSQDGAMWRVRVRMGEASYVLRVRDDADLERQVLAVEAAKARTITLGEREIEAPDASTAKTPTQDEIDLAAFTALLKSYRVLRAEVEAGLGKATQADVDAKAAEIKAAYKDEYAHWIVGVFG